MKKEGLDTVAPFLLVIMTLCCGVLLIGLIGVMGNPTAPTVAQPSNARPLMSNPTQPIQQPLGTPSPAVPASTPTVKPVSLSPAATRNQNTTPAPPLVQATIIPLPTVAPSVAIQLPTVAQPTPTRLPTSTPLPTVPAFPTATGQPASTSTATQTPTPTPTPTQTLTPTSPSQPSNPTLPTWTPSPTAEGASVPFFCDCSLGDLLDCEDFDTRGEAQACFEYCGGTANDVFQLDPDGDGLACEELNP